VPEPGSGVGVGYAPVDVVNLGVEVVCLVVVVFFVVVWWVEVGLLGGSSL